MGKSPFWAQTFVIKMLYNQHCEMKTSGILVIQSMQPFQLAQAMELFTKTRELVRTACSWERDGIADKFCKEICSFIRVVAKMLFMALTINIVYYTIHNKQN